ncbi:MAG: NifB/NifX family molybdenum-iron cluster-binding protein [Proteobacteria bacterium]|nr:NifB/NifX family molybdenum-iron cluster-binding protein [Pseudomonadota bacterium]MBU1582426.1 NifB/NifX family molybdenum-iron cluster-binding protein [Pseudomonadota bacterium]MBU2452500.1 NifB/NifX family molybdenum-iron cluster-binding protein [Pseudomonadota bacterium]MBU2631252.1 NifB/NifX family molybdenum-iron cluster-binding protein [Pseudomonadota bacterium]
MKIAVTSMGTDLDSIVDQRFGRAAYILIVDSDTFEFEVVDNTENVTVEKNAGINAAQRISKTGAKVLLTGCCGPKAFNELKKANIKVVQRVNINIVRKAVSLLIEGKLLFAERPNAESHWQEQE